MCVVFREHPCPPGWEPLLWSSASIWPEGRSNLPMSQAESWQSPEPRPPLRHSEGPNSLDGHSRLQHPPGPPPTSLRSPCSFWVMPLLQPDSLTTPHVSLLLEASQRIPMLVPRLFPSELFLHKTFLPVLRASPHLPDCSAQDSIAYEFVFILEAQRGWRRGQGAFPVFQRLLPTEDPE